ncbi:hypothetical protein FHX82_004899 [Amycolatopsis bartoniae]|uniref:Uncharacterized protein n=1 Tax=Amycolatopsis bartoniae TaxID=941986 RepID=A0A8H9IX29_9PSEU|nr:hypothetical protein [Amycolatopsis bartoniae]MBB2937823.1 hypothetical protein [Amycolatopsis bartoniae]TVT06513.1 hypothetical protein FNH07_19690 [Amycolatopsis bartoniae]GHF40975.1 hypothetical protein GCM10017566_13010 [Amycolatopsis bartoniae]
MRPFPSLRPKSALPTRRTVLAGSAAVAALATVSAAPAAAAPLSAADEDLLVQVARTVAVLPVPFPAFDETGPATGRATQPRLSAVLGRVDPAGRAALADGLGRLRTAGPLPGEPEALVRAIGRVADTAGALPGLTAVVATALATISSRFEPGRRPAAELWLDYARRFAAMPVGGAR